MFFLGYTLVVRLCLPDRLGNHTGKACEHFEILCLKCIGPLLRVELHHPEHIARGPADRHAHYRPHGSVENALGTIDSRVAEVVV